MFLSGFSLELSGFSLEIPDFSLDISNIPEYSSVKSGTITASRPRPCQCDTVRPCGAVSSDPIAAADVASWLAGSCGVHSSWAAAAARAAAATTTTTRAAVAAAVINTNPHSYISGCVRRQALHERVLAAAANGAGAAAASAGSSMDEQHTLI